MSFGNLSFLFLFLPLFLLLYVLTPSKYKNMVLLVASLFFYAWGNVAHTLFLLVLILMSYGLGLYIDQAPNAERKHRVREAVVLMIAVLAYTKYTGFLLDNINLYVIKLPAYRIGDIPLGISFYTFSILSYLIDVYRKKIPAERKWINLALYVSFFPKLIMGPIERYEHMKKQFDHHPLSAKLFEKGCGRFLYGMSLKLILADTFGVLWNAANTGSPTMMTSWLGILAYTLQIYFDFQGYTQMAIGLGNMFGFQLSENFHYPYLANSITDFWRRWHITLSLWFRDYVYIPLGGNRTSMLVTMRNLMIVWMLTGLWHGASWNFLLWGCYYGVLLIIEKYILYDLIQRLPNVLRWAYTMLAVMIGWVFFASSNVSDACSYLGSMMMVDGNPSMDANSLFLLKEYAVYLMIGIVCCTPLLARCIEILKVQFKEQLWFLKPIATVCVMLLLLSYLLSNTYQSFLYFQF